MTASRVDQILAEVFAQGSEDGSNLPGLLCEMAVRDLPIDGAGISLMDGDGVQLRVTATDERAQRLEELQASLGEGPCIDAFTRGQPVSDHDVRSEDDPRWPVFCRAAAQADIGAVFAFPLQLDAIRLGVLDLYRNCAGRLDHAKTIEALAFGDAAVAVLLHLQDRAPPEELPLQLDVAWMGQAEVHQATGMISVQAEVTLPDALMLLRARSFTCGQLIGDVAADVVERRIDFTTDADES